jgi:C1A family cysteine protease
MTLLLSPAGRRYGYLKDVSDHRDFGVGRLPLKTASASATNNGQFMGPVLDQGQQGSCTAHAGVGDREFLHWKEYARQGKPVAPGSDGLFSPSFLYYMERSLDGSLGQGDSGSYGRTSCKALNQYGCDLRVEMPYSDSDFSTAPSAQQTSEAKIWPSGGYHRLVTVDDMKSVIASGYNFRIGFTVYESFENINSTGVWSPSTKENVLGGHEVLAFGYDDGVNGGSFLVRNSWGSGWGLNGNFYLRYSDAADSNVLQDAWTQHLGVWK